MTFAEMKHIESELMRLERSARHAGENGASWGEWWAAADQALSKAVGVGARLDELRHWRCYEIALKAMHLAWRGRSCNNTEEVQFPWEAGWGTACDDTPEVQTELFDTSEAYR